MSAAAPLVALGVALFAGFGLAPWREDPATPLEGGLPACIAVSARARGGVGYDHLVTIQNGCAQTAACTVSTDVSPSPISVTVAAGASETVVTYRGSPASEFTPRVSCSLQ